MIELIKKLDSSILGVQPIIKYLEQFEKYKIVNEDIEMDNGKIDNGEIDIVSNDELIKILFLKISDSKWWSIYRYHSDGVKYEQIDVTIVDEAIEEECDTIIKFSGHVEDSNYSYITCSSFSYLNDETIRSWQATRVVPIEDLQKIQYSKDMNLTELIYMTDSESNNIIRKEEQKNIKKLVLKLESYNL